MKDIVNWNGKKYSKQDILDAIAASEAQEIDVSDAFDGDLATVPTIIKGLIEQIEALENK